MSTTVEADQQQREHGLKLLARRRRNTELGLLVLSVIITCSLYALAGLGRTASLPANILPFLGALVALMVIAHIANRIFVPHADPLLLPIASLLNGIGYVFIARLDGDLAGLQAGWTAVSVIGYIATLAVIRDIRILERYRFTLGLIGIGLLIMPLLPVIGREYWGSRIWVSIGPINFQPGEFAKIALAAFFAGYLVQYRELLGVATFRIGRLNTPNPKYLAPVLIAIAFSLVVMVFERDLGSALLFFILFIVMLWVSTGRASYAAVGMTLFLGAATLAWSQFSHVQDRVDIWLDPWSQPYDAGTQIVQSAYAFAWGGMTGTGPGLGMVGRIPADETDFIFAIIGEELGLLGTTAILAAYMLFAGSGLRIAQKSRDTYSSLLTIGLTALVAFQAFIIIAGVIRLLPLTGVTLPFVSYGGSSLIANYVLMGLIMRVSDQTEVRGPKQVVVR